jgi:hypothetical protein
MRAHGLDENFVEINVGFTKKNSVQQSADDRKAKSNISRPNEAFKSNLSTYHNNSEL